MTTESTELLRRYVAERSEPAFTELVQRHVDLVYSAALRQVAGDMPAAQDVTQAVFTGLARQAPRLTRHSSLTGWLYTSTRYLAAKARRTEQRRRAREQQAYAMNQLLQSPEPDPAWNGLAPILDDAMHELGAVDREAVLLRFFERQPLAEIGARLGLSENAARMRVDRALDKLRVALAKRGVTSTATALAAALAERAVGAAPAGLAIHVSHVAFAAGVAAGGSLLGLFKSMTLAKLHLLLGAAAVAVLITAPVWFSRARRRTASPGGEVKQQAPAKSNSAKGVSGTSNLLAAVQAPLLGARQDTLRLLVLADDTGKPIPRATLEYWVSEKGRHGSLGPATPLTATPGRRASTVAVRYGSLGPATPLTATELGACEIPVLRDAAGLLLLRSRTDGYVDTSFAWSPTRGELIPQEYTLRLRPAVSIGGRVVDSDGNPVAGAEVKLQVRDTLAIGSKTGSEVPHVSTLAAEKAVTDAAGRWRIDRFAKKAIPAMIGGATHSGFVADLPFHFASNFASVGPEAEAQLLAGTYVFKLERGVTLRGVVLDPDGRPVPEAKVVLLAVPRFRDTTSQADGSFTLTGCKLGANQLNVEAKGFALAILNLDVTNDPAPIRLTLQPGRLLRLRVLDAKGMPVPKANVSLDSTAVAAGVAVGSAPTFISGRGLFRWQTDADGRLEWDGAPDKELGCDVSASGYLRRYDVRVRPDGQEHAITLLPALTILGTVRDAATGRPVPHFRIITGGPSWHPADNTTNLEWSSGIRVNSDDGSFRLVRTEPPEGGTSNGWFAFKFQADGYAPFVTRPVRAVEGKVHFAVALQAVLATTVTVVLPDGRPAADADIGLVSPGAHLKLVPGGFSHADIQSRDSLLSTDDQGRFILPADEAITRVIAAHPEGYAETTPAALGADPAIRLQPWGRLEGTFLSGGQPAAGRALWFQYGPGDIYTVSSDFHAYEVTTDSDGHFVFPQVPPGKHKLAQSVQLPVREPGLRVTEHRQLLDVEIRPGETATVRLGVYLVTARVRWPEDFKPDPTWRIAGTLQTQFPHRQAHAMRRPQAPVSRQATPETKGPFVHIRLTQAADGTWVAEDVPAGTYELNFFDVFEPRAQAGPVKVHVHAEVPVTVPADPPSGTLDLGEIVLKPAP